MNIRLNLLSDHALNYILSETSSNYTNEEFLARIKNIIQKKKMITFNKNKHSDKTRFCSQSQFNIVVCGGFDNESIQFSGKVFSIAFNNLNNVVTLPKMKQERMLAQAVYIYDGVYLIGGFDCAGNCIKSVDKYSMFNNTWEKVTEICDYRRRFCACSFMDNIYVIGGFLGITTKSCLKFNTNDKNWNEFSVIKGARESAASAVFEGRVVVSGGYNYGILNTVEVYDHVADDWSYMPNMIEGRHYHKSVAVQNNLFLVGGYKTTSCEVYDSTCNNFVLIKPPTASFTEYLSSPAEAISVGSNLFVFPNEKPSILLYDVQKNEWSDESCELMSHLEGYCCVKLPQL